MEKILMDGDMWPQLWAAHRPVVKAVLSMLSEGTNFSKNPLLMWFAGTD